jgi:hypothetical protein
MTLLRTLLLILLPSVAIAGADLAPFNGAGGVQVSDSGKNAKFFYPVDPGQNLDYAFSGPGRIWVYVRSGARPKGSWSFPMNMDLILEVVATRIEGIPLAPALDNMGVLVDTESTYPWLSKGILIDVPEGAATFRLAARLDGPPLLVRVMVPGQSNETPVAETPQALPDAPAETVADVTEAEPDLLDDAFYGEEPFYAEEEPAMAENEPSESDLEATGLDAGDDEAVPEIIDAIPEEVTDESAAEEPAPPVGEETFGGLYEIFDEEAMVLSDDAPAQDTEEVADLSQDKESEAIELGNFSSRLSHSLRGTRLSVSTGLGAPIQGNQATVSVLIDGRIELFPLLSDAWKPGWGRLDLAINAGWYRLGVSQSLLIPDAIGGDTTMDISYATHVFPIALGIRYDLPVRLGPLLPFVGAGGGLNVVQRFGETPTSAVGAGWYTNTGVSFTAGPVEIAPSIRFNGGSATLNRKGVDGNPASENLSHLRLDLAVQTHF